MSSNAQIDANQRNALRSTGPRTQEGKSAVARNATAHGLAGAHIVLPGEDAAAFDALLDTLRCENAPANSTEDFLLQQMAQSQWKLLRAALIEQQIFSVAMGDSLPDTPSGRLAHVFLGSGPHAVALDRLGRYEAAARRAWFQSLKQLTALQRTANVQKSRDVSNLRQQQTILFDQAIEDFCRPPRPITEQTQFPPALTSVAPHS